MIQLGPEVAEIEFAEGHRAPDGYGFMSDAEVTVLPCGLVHIRPRFGQTEFTVPVSAIKKIRWNPFNRTIDYGPKTVAREVESLVVEAISRVEFAVERLRDPSLTG